MVFVSEIVKAGFLVTPLACYLCDVTTERKKRSHAEEMTNDAYSKEGK